MLNIDIKRIEIVTTRACSSKCKHCSVDLDDSDKGGINAQKAIVAIKKLTDRYNVETIMTFGGEPLLYAETVCKIHSAARDCGIEGRAVITNGFFSRNAERIKHVAASLAASGVDNIYLSVDAFHQEHVPINFVTQFAEAVLKQKIPTFRVHPAWLVNKDNENSYNEETKRLLTIFEDMGIETSSGNDIFPAGNATKYLGEYFNTPTREMDLSIPCGEMPYTAPPNEVECVSIEPNGDLSLCSFAIGNIYEEDVLEILDRYDPYSNPITLALIKGGAAGLLSYAESVGITVDTSDCYSACQVCKKIMKKL